METKRCELVLTSFGKIFVNGGVHSLYRFLHVAVIKLGRRGAAVAAAAKALHDQLHVQLPDDDFDVIFLSNCGFGNARGDILQMIHSIIYERDDVQKEIEMDKGYIKN